MTEQFDSHETVTVREEPHKTCLACGYCAVCRVTPSRGEGVCVVLGGEHVTTGPDARRVVQRLADVTIERDSLLVAAGATAEDGQLGVALRNIARTEAVIDDPDLAQQIAKHRDCEGRCRYV